MGCGDCASKIERLERELGELRDILAQLRSEYLDLASDYDILRGAVEGDDDGDNQENEDD